MEARPPWRLVVPLCLALAGIASVGLFATDAQAHMTCFPVDEEQACTLGDGCSGIRVCMEVGDGHLHWGACSRTPSSSRSCSCGGVAGTQKCLEAGGYESCARSCSDCPGDGELETCPNSTACQTCTGPFGPCQPLTASSEVVACDQCDSNRNGQLNDGVKPLTCVRASGCPGLKGCEPQDPCDGCDGASRTGVACTTACTTAGTMSCGLTCEPSSSCAAAAESCNQCDDTLNGVVDEGLGGECAPACE